MRRVLVRSLVVLLLLVAIGYGYVRFRWSRARSRLEATVAGHVAAEGGAPFAALRAELARLDPARQDDTARWMESVPKAPGVGHRAPPSWLNALGATEADLDGAATWIEDTGVWADPMLDVLRAHGGCLTSAGMSLPVLLAEGEPNDPIELRLPNLIAVRSAAGYALLRALTRSDPVPALDDLDRLRAAMRPALTVLDAALGVAVEDTRDDAYLALAIRERLPEARLRAWASEPPSHFDLAADALRGERTCLLVPVARAVADGRALEGWLGVDPRPRSAFTAWDEHVAARWRVPEEAIGVLNLHVALETWLRTGRGGEHLAGSMTTPESWPWSVVHCNLPAVAQLCADRDTRLRATRSAGLLIASARGGGGLPKDHADARLRLGGGAASLEASPRGYALRYERLSAQAFRIAVDPRSPVPPPCAEGDGRLPHGREPPDLATASASPATRRADWGVEVRLP